MTSDVVVQELGHGTKIFSKEEKQDLMHIGICKILSLSGYYELEGLDKDGWPHWKATEQLPFLKAGQQTILMKTSIIEYFKTREII